MEEYVERMKAYATGFDEIKVYLSRNYYDGISNKFYLKNLKTDELELLSGDISSNEEEGYRVYTLNASFELGLVYKIIDAYGLTCFLDFRRLSLTDEFDNLYYYDKDDLGCTYTKDQTTFKVWSPLSTGVILKTVQQGEDVLYPMKRGKKGVYEITLRGDYEGVHYFFLVKFAGKYNIAMDPYAYATTSNGRACIVLDPEKLKIEKSELPEFKHKTDAIIYETSVRDFSMNKAGKMKYRGKFLAFSEEGTRTDTGKTTGLDYLSEIGITHIQLMPINDFATVDEANPLVLYNWGYDPAQYNVTEGSYVTEPNDGYKRVQEAQKMIQAIHSRGIRVVLDVVYNHMHDINNNALEMTTPLYFFRRYKDGTLSNGSWCGNDLNTSAKMCRKYILDMCKRWQVLYGCDGFRFDLMGLIDMKTIKMVEEQGRKIDRSFMVYGEGWNMNTAIEEKDRTTIQNNRQVPNIGFFNDFFRNTSRGTNQMENKGYFAGDTYKTNEAIKAMCNYDMFSNIEQSINYVECHDNATTYDKLKISNYDEEREDLRKRAKMMIGAVLLSQGIPFIHSGQEFYRSKRGQTNTYNAGDSINALDWSLRDRRDEAVEFFKFIVKLRKDNPCFRYYNYDMMRENVKLENLEHRIIKYSLKQTKGKYSHFIIYMNPSKESFTFDVDKGYHLLYHMDDKIIINDKIEIPGISMVILVK
jgi:pullulanase